MAEEAPTGPPRDAAAGARRDWTTLALAALLVGGWLVTIPIADRHGTDEPFPLTAFPMYSRVPGPRAPFNVLLVAGEGGDAMADPRNATVLDSEQAFDGEHRQRFGPARGAFEAIRASWAAGCPDLRADVDDRSDCAGDPDDFRLPPELAQRFAAAAQARLGLAETPEQLTFGRLVVPLDQRIRDSRGVRVEALFSFDARTGEVLHG